MSSMKLLSSLVFTLGFTVTFTSARTAAAEACGDTECPRGFTCVATKVTAGTAPACPRDAPDCGKTPPAPPMETTVYSCEPKACANDSDCGEGMVCHQRSIMECTGGAAVAPCPPNTECPPAPPQAEPMCTTKTESTCAFKWQLPCNADAECGSGFTCQPSGVTSCSGSGSAMGGGAAPSSEPRPSSGTGGSAGSRDAPAVDGGAAPTCTTTTSFPGYCQLREPSCATDADCPAAWKCTEQPIPGTAPPGSSTPTREPGSTSTSSPPAPTPSDGPAPASMKVCTSPYGIARGGDVAAGSGSPTSAPQPAAGEGAGSLPPSAPPGMPTVNTPPTDSNGGGCAVGPRSRATGPVSLAVLALLGLIVGRRTRRQ